MKQRHHDNPEARGREGSGLRRFTVPWGGCYACLCLSLCVSFGCGFDLLSFSVGTRGLQQPSLELSANNALRIIQRIRWFETVRDWENERLGIHELSLLIGEKMRGRLRRFCETPVNQCGDCLRGTLQNGTIDLSCWTRDAFSGSVLLNLPEVSQTGGTSFMTWNSVCQGAGNNQLCARGDIGYSVLLDDFNNPQRLELTWIVRLWMREGGEGQQELRLDGVIGAVYERRDQAPQSLRRAIFIEQYNLLYQNYDATNRRVDVLASNGSFRCRFEAQARSGQCTNLETGVAAFSW